MSFMDYLKKAWEIIKLNKEVIAEMAADEKALGPAIGVVAISGVCLAIGTWNALGLIVLPIVRLIGFFIFFGIAHFVATSFLGGKGDFKKLMAPVGLAAMVTWVAILPLPPLAIFLAVVAGLWMLVPSVLAMEHVYGLDRGKAVIALAVPLVLGVIVMGIFAAIGAAIGLALLR